MIMLKFDITRGEEWFREVKIIITLLALTFFGVSSFTELRVSESAEPRKGVVKAEEGLYIGFLWPLRGISSSQYGMRRDPISHDLVRHHAGLDISAPAGTLVVASRAGRVTFAGAQGGTGTWWY